MYCQSEIEGNGRCKNQCEHCNDYYKPLEDMKDYFSESEFKACVPSCRKSDMQAETLCKLNNARHIAGIPFVLNSAYRSPAHDKAKGRSGTGAHTLGRAVDIRCNTSENRYEILTAGIAAGFTRIGIHKTFVHLDDSPNHAQGVIWLY